MKHELECLLSADISADELATNKALLDSLTMDEKIEFSTKIITLFPTNKLANMVHLVEALRHPLDNTNSFYEIVTKALDVRQRIEGMLDCRNPHPHYELIKPEFDQSNYLQFQTLSNQLVEKNAEILAERLATITPAENTSELVRNINLAFGERSAIALSIEKAMGNKHKYTPSFFGELGASSMPSYGHCSSLTPNKM